MEEIKEPLLENNKDQAAKVKPASFLSLFKYSDGLDKVYMLIGSLAGIGAGASMPFFVIYFSDISLIFITGNEGNAEHDAKQIMIKFFIIGGFTWFLNFVGLYSWNITGSRQALRFKKLYYQSLLEQEVAWYDSNDVNKLSTEISTNMVAVETAISEKVCILLTTLVTTTFGFVYAYFKCWQLSLVLTGTLPLMIFAGILLMKAMMMKANISKISYEGAASFAQQAFGSIRAVKSMVGEEFENNKFVKALSESQKKVVKCTFQCALSFGAMNIIFLGLYSFGFFFGKQLIIWHPQTYSSPEILSTFFCFLIGGSSIGQISPIFKNIAEGRVAAGQLQSLLTRKKTLIQPTNGIKVQQIDSLSLNNVSFKYEKVSEEQNSSIIENSSQTQILNDICLNFGKGKVTALVGESGCGKSTIIQLLMRYYDPAKGSILVNGLNLQQIDVKEFRRKVGFVGQQPVLFSMSIAENLRLANPDLTDEEIGQILKKANAWNFVSKTKEGIDTFVGTNGVQLSGGQKQRIAIARAIAKNPKILILDEATSALDRKNQKQIQQTLNNLSEENMTIIVIAHRLSTIQNASNIVVINKGKLIEQGTHKELTHKQGSYYNLIKSQMVAQEQEESHHINQSQIEDQKDVIVQEKEEDEKEKNKQEIPKEKLDAVFGKVFKEFKGNYLLLLIGSLSAFVNGLIWPFFNIAFSKIMAKLAFADEYSSEINGYCLLFLGVAIFGGIFTFLYQFLFGISGERLVFHLRKKLYYKILCLQMSYFDKSENTPGGLSTKLSTDTQQIHNMITGISAVVCMNIATVVASLSIALYYSWQLTLIALALTPLIAVSGAINMSIIKEISQKSSKFQKAAGSMISDTVCNIRTVKSFGNEKTFLELFAKKLEAVFQLNSEKSFKNALFQGLSRGSIMFVEGLIFYLAAILFANGYITDPVAIYISIFSIIFAAMGVGQNSQFMPDMGKAKHSGASIFEILETKDQIEKNEETEDISLKNHAIKGDISFKNVVFQYPQREAKVLNYFNLQIKSGQKIGLVGPSGSGKSTVVQLLMNFYDIQSGQILIDGRNIKNYNLRSLRRQLGLVSQEPPLFQDSVKNNIVYSSQESIGQNQIDQIAEIAHAKNFIEEWDQKYQKNVGQKGSQVSGGQKQRIALVRCLIRKPSVLLFDQFTSALDADTQRIVFKNLQKKLQGHTSLTIAHRLPTIEDSDKIIVMRDGKIIEEGKYNQLMNLQDHFYKLAKGIN